MATFFKRIIGISIISFICFSQVMLAQKALFTDVGSFDLAKMNSTQQHYLNNIQTAPTTARYRVVQINDINQLLTQASVHLNVFDGQQFTFSKSKIEQFDDGSTVWYGKFSTGSAVLVIQKDMLTGNIRVDGELFQVEPLSGGLHAIIHFDGAGLPPEHLPENPSGALEDHGEEAEELQENQSAIEGPSPLNPQAVTIDVLVVYTATAARSHGNIPGLIRTAIAETNQSYGNSNIAITVSLAHSAQIDHKEKGYTGDDARAIMKHRRTLALREQYNADVCMIIVQESSACGTAVAIGANAGNAFCGVKVRCATGYYSFAHEIGHLQGARHDRRVDKKTTPYPYAHGLVHKPGSWRTIMAYNDSGCCTRIQYWSNPNVSYQGVRMGSTTHEDNARALNTSARKVAGFRGRRVFAGKQNMLNQNTLLNKAPLAGDFNLQQNYPNPFNPSTTIRYTLKKSSQVSLVIYDASGKQVRKLLNTAQAAGNQSIVWDGKNDAGQSAASGSYFYHITADDFKAVKKMQLLK